MSAKFDGMHNEHPTNELRGTDHHPRGPSLALRAIHLVPRLRRVADMCSSKVSVNCEYFTKWADTLVRPTVVKLRLPFPFSKRSPVSGNVAMTN